MSSLDLLASLQHARTPLIDAAMVGLSALGSEVAYMALLTIIYLCVSHRFGFQLFVMFLLGAFANGVLKHTFTTARPYEMYPELLHPLAPEGAAGPAFPSGHAQNAATTWGLIAVRQRSRAAHVAIGFLIAGISFSRLYCAVHWPADILGGLVFGGLSVLAYLVAVGAWQVHGARLSPVGAVGLVACASAVMWLWGAGIDVCVRAAGALLGAGVGYVLLEGRGGYKAQAPPLTQLVKVAVALAVLFGVRVGARLILGDSDPANYLRYALIGLTCSYLLPVFFAEYHNWRRRAHLALQAVGEDSDGPGATRARPAR